MSSFARRCGVHDLARGAACQRALAQVRERGLKQVRIAWCDLHGELRGKALMAALPPEAPSDDTQSDGTRPAPFDAVADALTDGLGMVSTVLLKDSSDRTAYPVFEPGALDELSGFGFANNLLLLPDPASLCELPWAPGTGWMRAQAWFTDGTPVPIDPRHVLQQALARLASAGYGLRCGLEVEFHIYRIDDDRLDPALAAWPGEPPRVSMIHPGYNLLAEAWSDRADEPLAIVRHTAQGLGLPLRSLEIELGPSQVEAVFGATDALSAADQMVRFRSGVKQALRRAGYHASFMCRPPFANAMASGWHLHQSLVDLASGANAMQRLEALPNSDATQAGHSLSDVGVHYLAGLLAHARGTVVFGTPSINGHGRFRPNAMAPKAVQWGRDNRGAMLRVLGGVGDAGTRIENRVGEPMANPYLYIAAQVHAGLDGILRQLIPPLATDSPYGDQAPLLPTTLAESLRALDDDAVIVRAFGQPLVRCLQRIKRSELARFEAADDPDEWQRREYFSRF